MGTKQLRLSDAAQIKTRIGSFVGKPVNLVLSDNTAQTGLLEAVSESSIVLRNMRLKKMNFTLNQITEIYIDTNA
ncbi:hypothetical protein [Pseudochryseolinea flava]|uniref:Ferrous iron transport protein A n=1 Tax=Pseudochryseolinea flava TaxID=2059302 RepID=A0A364Y2M7_9BACT|nr:hypothetical protein [Pseudochryseolinea flava]RAW01030.1 hypothetical protein DQQ10_12415 [Pseudochryseolinea flava]